MSELSHGQTLQLCAADSTLLPGLLLGVTWNPIVCLLLKYGAVCTDGIGAVQV